MAINKVIFGSQTLMDTTGVTVTSNTMTRGTTALAANGETITGALDTAPLYNDLDKTSEGYALDARQGKVLNDKITELRPPSVALQIPTSQWSGSGPYTYTTQVSNITANTIPEAEMDDTINNLTSDLSVTTGAGTITLSTVTLPSGTVNVTVFFPGVQSEVVTQVLADVYSTSQAVAKADIVNNLTSTTTDKPLSAAQGKALNDLVAQSTAKEVTAGLTAAANVTINNQHKAVSGPIRVYAIIFTASANIARDTALISGFDTQRLTANGTTNFIMYNNNTHAEHTCFLGSDGALRCNDTINANEMLRGTLVYIST